MPGKIKVKVLAGRNLPVMDRAGDTTDAFVEIKFGGVTHKTDVCRKSLNPHWNSTEWYRFEVDESELQDEPLQLRLMDHDTYSANDAIGKVVISLAPLLAREAVNAKSAAGSQNGALLSGWIPVFDTMHGIRGELNVIVKVELFSDFNKYKTSSCGVQFFHCPMIPPGYKVTAIHGFVEELVVNDDPEYQWIDKIRTPRASNEARQVAFIKLGNQVQRLVGLKAAELGANAVVGYQQDFDLEGEAGVVARAIGTAVNITPQPTQFQQLAVPPCSQQQLKKYLDILATDSETTTDLNQYFTTHQDELYKLVSIMHPKTSTVFDDNENLDEDDRSFELTRQSSINSYFGNASIYQDEYMTHRGMRHLSEDQGDLNKLLKKNDEEDSDSSGPFQKLKKIKDVFFVKRLGSGRSRKSDKQDDQVSIKSNSSDTSKISLTEIKNEFKKMRIKKPTFRKTFVNPDDQGIGMASILARSVIHAHTSLACIAESQDSEHSPSSTLRRTSESEPNINLIEENSPKKTEMEKISEPDDDGSDAKSKVPDIYFTSLNNVSSQDVEETVPRRERKISESCPSTPGATRSDNCLKAKGLLGYFGSNSSALSGASGESSEMFSSSEEDEKSSDFKTQEQVIETTSSIVNTIMQKNSKVDLASQVEKKESSLDNASQNTNDSRSDSNAVDSSESYTESGSTQSSTEPEKENVTNKGENIAAKNEEPSDSSTVKKLDMFIATKPDEHHFRFHNPFSHRKVSKSISAPSSPVEKSGFVYRSSSKIKRQLSKISKSSMIKSLSHYSLIPKRKHVETKPALSQPSSSSDVPSKAPSHETVLGSPFLSYANLLCLDKDANENSKQIHHSDEIRPKSKVSMYIGSEPVSRASVSGPSSPQSGRDDHHAHDEKPHRLERRKSSIKPTGLLHTAMETILIDKVQSLLIPTSPEVSIERKFFDDVNLKLEKVEEDRNKIKTDQEPVTRNGDKKLIRQDSIHSSEDGGGSRKMSEDIEPNIIPCKLNTGPMLQHFHPLLSGAHKLETIESLTESSFDRSLDIDVDETCESNNGSVCDNSHAAWRVDRGEREREREKKESERDRGSPRHARHESYGGKEPANHAQSSSANSTSTPMGIHRRSSDSDLSVTPKGSSLNASGNTGSGGGAILRPSMNSNNLDMLEYPFLTMTEYPPGFIVHLGGTVCARSVKLVEGESASGARAAWWAELRTELRAHARALRCNAVLALAETSAICEDVCVLSASGTAAVINLDCDFNAELDVTVSGHNTKTLPEEVDSEWCGAAHVPYSAGAGPYRAELSACGACRRARVPAVLLATCSKPNRLAAYTKAVTLTAVAVRMRRAQPSSEPGARDISDQLPFLEYELHKLLLAKLRMQGANAIFNLRTQICVGERCVVALAAGAAHRLAALPAPKPPRIKSSEKDKNALEIQKALLDTFTANKAANGYDISLPEFVTTSPLPEVEAPALELSADKDACVLELDEAEDVETAMSLACRRQQLWVFHAGLTAAPQAAPQAFAQVWRARLPACVGGAAERHVSRALDGAAYKLRRLRPLALVAPSFQIDLPEDEIQIILSGAAIPLQDPTEESNNNHEEKAQDHSGAGDAEDEIFALDEEEAAKSEPVLEEKNVVGQVPTTVSLTSLHYMCGSRYARRICALRLLFVRETTAVRELGGLSGFLHTFTCEVLCVARSYTAALGGNSLTSFYLTQLMLQDNAHKNQAQCLLSVGGDVVQISY